MRAWLACSLLLMPLILSAAVPSDPVGTWECALSGKSDSGADKGTVYLTFSAAGGLTGYGLTLRSNGPITFSGTWQLDEKGRVVFTFTQFLGSTAVATGSATIKAKPGKSLSGKATSTVGTFALKGIPQPALPAIGGAYTATFKEKGGTSTLLFTLTANDSFPGVYVLSGAGTGSFGAFTTVGVYLVSSKSKANAGVLSTLTGTNQTSGFALYGSHKADKGTAKLSGFDTNGSKVKAAIKR